MKIYDTKDASGLSAPAFGFYLFSCVVWFVYGAFVIQPRSWPIMVSNVVAFILGAILLCGILMYSA
jgi:uncharacterized protein with PQ loop repeat